MSVTVLTSKAKKFNKVLLSAKDALDSINVNFHLHAGTALGAHREKTFIQHDDDIDLAVFYKDVDNNAKLKALQKAMIANGFVISSKLGKLESGKEIQFEKNGISLDIFWVYEGEYRGKEFYILSSYYGRCDKLPYKQCVWGYRPYKVQRMNFLGKTYQVVPKKTIEDMYGKDWKIPKKFGYFDGIQSGSYKGFLKDYFEPRATDKKIAFCFLLYDEVKHRGVWEKFFKGDDYPVPSFNIYAHVKKVTDKTPEWIEKAKIRTVKTEWCEESLVTAWVNMLKTALKDPNNKYFALLSGECIPLYNYSDVYKRVFSSKRSRLNIDMEAEAFEETGLYYADQWVTLNRKHAKMLVNLMTTEEGRKFRKMIKRRMCKGDTCYCHDELYAANWFVYKYGKPNSKEFKTEFNLKPSTYTFWNGDVHPIRFNNSSVEKKKKEICNSKAVFARKFNNKTGRNISCSKEN